MHIHVSASGLGGRICPTGSCTSVKHEENQLDAKLTTRAQALDAGVGISNDMMVQMLTQLCSRRACARLELRPPTPKEAAQPLTLLVEGVGSLTVDPTQEVLSHL